MAWATTADCLRLNLKRLIEIFGMQAGGMVRNTSVYWGEDRERGSSVSVVEFSIGLDGLGLLHLKYKKNDKPQEQIIRLEATCPHYGGFRWWFICPETKERCQHLYLGRDERGFVSRKALHLVYPSQRENLPYRALRKYHKKCEAYGADYGGPYFTKPKGMHLRTYKKRLAELEQLDERKESIGFAFYGM